MRLSMSLLILYIKSKLKTCSVNLYVLQKYGSVIKVVSVNL